MRRAVMRCNGNEIKMILIRSSRTGESEIYTEREGERGNEIHGKVYFVL